MTPTPRDVLAAILHDAFHGETEHKYVECPHQAHWNAKAARLRAALAAADLPYKPEVYATLIRRFLCRFGFHDWFREAMREPDGSISWRTAICLRCHGVRRPTPRPGT